MILSTKYNTLKHLKQLYKPKLMNVLKCYPIYSLTIYNSQFRQPNENVLPSNDHFKRSKSHPDSPEVRFFCQVCSYRGKANSVKRVLHFIVPSSFTLFYHQSQCLRKVIMKVKNSKKQFWKLSARYSRDWHILNKKRKTNQLQEVLREMERILRLIIQWMETQRETAPEKYSTSSEEEARPGSPMRPMPGLRRSTPRTKEASWRWWPSALKCSPKESTWGSEPLHRLIVSSDSEHLQTRKHRSPSPDQRRGRRKGDLDATSNSAGRQLSISPVVRERSPFRADDLPEPTRRWAPPVSGGEQPGESSPFFPVSVSSPVRAAPFFPSSTETVPQQFSFSFPSSPSQEVDFSFWNAEEGEPPLHPFLQSFGFRTWQQVRAWQAASAVANSQLHTDDLTGEGNNPDGEDQVLDILSSCRALKDT